MKKHILTFLSILIILFGFVHFLFATFVSWVDTGSVKIEISRGQIDQKELLNFKFSEWRPPTEKIQPFICENKSYKNYKIIRYRKGSWPHWLVWRSYYEAEYLKPDGSKEIGPAFGPLPYTAPNLLVSISIVSIGLVLLVIGLFVKSYQSMERNGLGGGRSST